MEAAVVDPDTRSSEEPKSTAMMVGIKPACRPHSSGMPAMVAQATTWLGKHRDGADVPGHQVGQNGTAIQHWEPDEER